MTTVHVVVPEGIDDPARPSGGNVYDRHVCDGLAAIGWTVREYEAGGDWPHPDEASLAALGGLMRRFPDGAVVLVDGLVASTAPDALVPHAGRLRIVVLMHMPLGDDSTGGVAGAIRTREAEVLRSAAAVVATSEWTRRRLTTLYALPIERVHVAQPGVDAADLAPGTGGAGGLLCVAALTAGKGHDVLLDALAMMAGFAWHCVCVGSLDRDPAFADHVRRRVSAVNLGDRVTFAGPLTGSDLDRAYSEADVLLLASRAETYGMVVSEALARGLPVIATDVGGVREALGHGQDGQPPGLLVTPGDRNAFAAAVRSWIVDSDLRSRLRTAARERRLSLPRWSATVSGVATALRVTGR